MSSQTRSTLLDILAGRKQTGTVEGSILYNGMSGDECGERLQRVSGYVTQVALFWS